MMYDVKSHEILSHGNFQFYTSDSLGSYSLHGRLPQITQKKATV